MFRFKTVGDPLKLTKGKLKISQGPTELLVSSLDAGCLETRQGFPGGGPPFWLPVPMSICSLIFGLHYTKHWGYPKLK